MSLRKGSNVPRERNEIAWEVAGTGVSVERDYEERTREKTGVLGNAITWAKTGRGDIKKQHGRR